MFIENWTAVTARNWQAKLVPAKGGCPLSIKIFFNLQEFQNQYNLIEIFTTEALKSP